MSRLLCIGTVAGALALSVAGTAQAAAPSKHSYRGVCAAAKAGRMSCLALQVTVSGNKPLISLPSAPSGYGPAQIQGAYKLASAASSKGAGETVAIVDAYNQPDITSDLATYRSQYGLPAADGKSGDPTFKVVNQTGGTSL